MTSDSGPLVIELDAAQFDSLHDALYEWDQICVETRETFFRYGHFSGLITGYKQEYNIGEYDAVVLYQLRNGVEFEAVEFREYRRRHDSPAPKSEPDDKGSEGQQLPDLLQYYLERKPAYLKDHLDAPVILFVQNGRIEERFGTVEEKEIDFLERMEKEYPVIEEANEIFLDTVRLKPANFSRRSRVMT
jgi:hypothetical protein